MTWAEERPPLGNVLVATDFSAAATRAVERAARLPLGPGATLTVLHVLPPGGPRPDRAAAEHALGDAASIAAEAAARAGRRDVVVVERLVEGTPFVEIVRAARGGRDELIVVGRHGEQTFRELLLGSTAERVVRKGDTAVLIVAAPTATAYTRPLVAVDCSDTSRSAVALASRLADPGARPLEVVHAYEATPERALRRVVLSGEGRLEQRLEARRQAQTVVETFLGAGDGGPPATIVVREGDPRQVILDTAWRTDADLLALGTHGRSGLAHLLLGSVAEAVIRAARCDVLVVRAAGLPFELP